MEIVGPGFDASDLKRGLQVPHEWVRLPADAQHASGEGVTRECLSEDEYRFSRERRIGRIRDLLQRSEDLIDLEAWLLREHPLFVDYPTYRPIPDSLLNRAIGVFRRVEDLAPDGSSQPFVLSMSFIGEDARLVCWDLMQQDSIGFPP